MKRGEFSAHVLVALGLSGGGVGVVLLAGFWLATSLALSITMLVLAALYLLWLYACHHQRSGLSLMILGWVLVSTCALLMGFKLVSMLLLLTALIWLVRSGLRYRKAWWVLADAALCLLSVAVSVWIAQVTHSVFLSLWGFFFVQALSFFLPDRSVAGMRVGHANDRFSVARNHAEAALKRL